MRVIKPSKIVARGLCWPRGHEKSTGDGILMKSGWLRCALVVCGLMFWVSCGGSSRSTFLYLASQGANPGEITAYRLDLNHGTLNSSNGALVQNGKSFATGVQPGPMIFDPTNNFAFVADFGNPLGNQGGDIAAFSVNKDGTLSSLGLTATPMSCVTLNPVALSMDSKGQFLFVANQAFYNVSSGATCPTQPANGTPAPGFITVFPVSSGKLGAGTSTPLPVPPGTTTTVPTPSAVAVSNLGSFVYVTDSTNAVVDGFAYDANGTLSFVPGQFFTVGNTPKAVLSPPAGGPTAMLTDPTAKYLYALANNGSQITGYTVNHVTGALTAITVNGGTVSTGANPVAFTIRSDGSTRGDFWVFTSNFGANSVSSYLLNGATGTLSPLPQLTAPVGPFGILAH
ncbi:MAG: hypothetical protein DMG83_16170 [Acidobacteria bacterium]|nr:MAG: hypothetical protein DMG83_16170 [Acidobacteriota bacterium]